MSPKTKGRRRAARLPFSALLLLAGAVVAAITVTAPAAGTAPASGKPVIGKFVAVPAEPVAGKLFTVTFRLTRSDTGAPLARGTMICAPSVAGRTIPHTESFKRGTARLSLVVPASAAGKALKVKVTIKSGKQSATKVVSFRVQGAQTQSVSVGDSSAVEGNGATTTLSFAVTLSAAATQTVSVDYATSDGTATAPSDYAAASGTLTFARGEKAKEIQVGVVGDLAIEPDETLTVTITNPVNGTIADATATGTIRNDDTAVPVTPGNYKGATQEGNYVFFTVTASRTVTAFRINALPCECDGPLRLTGGEDFGDSTFTIRADGSFRGTGDWTGSNVRGDVEWLHWDATLTGQFTSSTTVAGTILENYELKYKGTRYRCSTGLVTWTATLQA